MSTVNKEIADKVVAGNGFYPGDREKVVRIVKYQNMFNGGDSYGLVYAHQDKQMYHKSPAVRNPQIYWEAK